MLSLPFQINCNDIVLFWRIQQVIKVTANALRQQVINREARRLDKEVKDVLDEYGDDDDKKQQLLTGKRVQLAEELSEFRFITMVYNSIPKLKISLHFSTCSPDSG